MAITFGSVGSYPASPFTQNGATSMAVPYPSGITAGEALILCAANSSPDAWTTPSGWTSVESNSNVLTDLSVAVYTKVATGAETGTLTVTHSAAVPIAGCIVRYPGVSASPFGDTANAISSVDTGTTSPTNGVLSPAPGASDMVVRFYTWAMRGSSTGATLTNPGGTWSTRLNLMTNASGTFNVGIVVADKIAGTDNQTVTSNVAGAFMVVDVALVAAVAASTAKFMPFFM